MTSDVLLVTVVEIGAVPFGAVPSRLQVVPGEDLCFCLGCTVCVATALPSPVMQRLP